MAELPYMPVDIDADTSLTLRMTPEQYGAHMRLMKAMWRAGGYLPNNEREFVQITGCGTLKKWQRMAPMVLRGMTISGELISSPELLYRLDLTRARQKARSLASNTRWQKSKSLIGQEVEHANAYANVIQTGSNQNQNITKTTSFLIRPAKGLAMQELFEDGAHALVHVGGWSHDKAKKKLQNWLGNIENDAEILLSMIKESVRLDHRGPRMGIFVQDQVQRHAQRLAPRLPFRPHKASG